MLRQIAGRSEVVKYLALKGLLFKIFAQAHQYSGRFGGNISYSKWTRERFLILPVDYIQVEISVSFRQACVTPFS
jgi:hypothetical protein